MKNLVFGALISALSFSAFAVVSTTDHDMHSASDAIQIVIQSTGTDVKFEACDGQPAALPVVRPTMDGNNVSRNEANLYHPFNYYAVFNSLHYGESFTICTKIKLTGGYIGLGRPGYKVTLGSDLNFTSGSTSYLDESGLQMSAVAVCKNRRYAESIQGWNHETVVMTGSPVASFLSGTQDLVGTFGLPESCEVRFTFTETNHDQRENSAGETVRFNLDLDVSID